MSTGPDAAPAGHPRLPAGLKVLLADEHAGVRTALAALLRGAGVAGPCAEAADGHEAWARLQSAGPDLALVDVALPGIGGLALLRRLRAAGAGTPVLMLSTHAGPGYGLRAFEAGANGYIGKDAPAPSLVAAARAVASGGSHVPDALAELVRLLPQGRVHVEPHARLSARELRLLKLLAGGLSESEAAQQLGLGRAEAARSRDRIAQKLGLAQAEDWQRYAQAHGLGWTARQ